MADTGWLNFTSASNESLGGQAWSNPGNALVADGSYTDPGSVAKFASTDSLRLLGIDGLSDPGGGMQPTGIRVRINGYRGDEAAFGLSCLIGYVLHNTLVASYTFAGLLPPTAAGDIEFGEDGNIGALTWEDLTDPEFGADIFFGNSYFVADTPHIDFVQVKIFYDFPASSPNPPGSPTNVVATVINATTVSVSFDPPESDGGATILGYGVSGSADGVFGGGPSSPILVTVPSGFSQTFTVSASNSAGNSPPSEPSNAEIPQSLTSSLLAILHLHGASL